MRAVKVLIIIGVVAFAALFWARFFGVGKKPVYRSCSLIQIAGDDSCSLISVSSNTCYLKVDGLSYRETQMDLIRSALIVAKTRERLKIPAEVIASNLVRLAVIPRTNSAILSLRVDSYDPQFSADYANAWVEAYLDYKAEERVQAIKSTLTALVEQANGARAGPNRSTKELHDLELLAMDMISSNKVVQQQNDIRRLQDFYSELCLELKKLDTALALEPQVVRQVERAVPPSAALRNSIWP